MFSTRSPPSLSSGGEKIEMENMGYPCELDFHFDVLEKEMIKLHQRSKKSREEDIVNSQSRVIDVLTSGE